MKYLGSKNKIAKELVPIIQQYITAETKGYLEPFVGGANVIDKINCHNKIGADIHPQLIALLSYAQSNYHSLPQTISEEEYKDIKDNKSKHPDWMVGLAGFCASYGARYFEGYARGTDAKGHPRDMAKEGIDNLKRQAPNLQGIKFICSDFLYLDVNQYDGYVVYCDIPYQGTKTYSTKKFPYDKFFDWSKEMAKHNKVLVSEYNMPEDFRCIWEKKHQTLISKGRKNEDTLRVEKLYLVE